MVALVREPNNPYDSNAIQVNNIYGDKVGHIKKELAVPLAFVMDNNLAKIEGIVPFGVTNSFTMPVNLQFWGKTENRSAVIDKLNRHGYKLAPSSKLPASERNSYFSSMAFSPGRPKLAAVRITNEELKNEFDKLFENLTEDKAKEMEPADVSAIGTPLLPHQKQALAWMVTQENSNDLPPFWEQKNDMYYNLLTNFAVRDKPTHVLGGLLSDEMGLGKTLSTIALIVTNFHNGKPLPVKKIKKEHLKKDQFEQHIRPEVNLNMYVYHGSERKRDPAFLSKQDVVLTTYNVITVDFTGANGSPLHQVNWLRVVLDEGHVIRNPGTPIQNSLKDIWPLVCFLKLKPFEVKEWWNRTIQRPVMLGDEEGLRYFNEGTVLTNYADVLVILLRLRQLCCHPLLLGSSTNTNVSTGDAAPSELRDFLINKMNLVLSSGSDEECAICLDSLRLPVITYCAHVYCKLCICQVIRSEKNAKCPLCRADININQLVEFPEEKSESESKIKSKWLPSSKIDALMHELLKLRNEDPGVKSLVVSQFTAFLSLIEIPLRNAGFIFTRFDGSLSQAKRTTAVKSFQSSHSGSPTVMLLSLKAGGVGLNLTAASRVFLMDPFIVKDSVEENMMKMQEKKRDLATRALANKTSQGRQARIEEIKTLMDL
ncbi:HLTF factor, partial [Polypterus senegalus]